MNLQEVTEWVKNHKRSIAVGGAVIIANTVAGNIFIDQANRMTMLEGQMAQIGARFTADEQVMGILMEEDVRTTDAMCRQAEIIGALSGLPAPSDAECDENTEKQIQYWRGVIQQAMEAGGTK